MKITRKMKAIVLAATAAAMLCAAAVSLHAQEPAEKSQAKEQPKNREEFTYRLDFSINEMNEGKKVNSRQYSTNATGNSGGRDIKIGTRVPVETVQGQFTYMDVGTNIISSLREANSSLVLDVTVELNNFAIPNEAQSEAQKRQPVVRQVKFGGSAVVSLGKTIVICSADDPNSTRQFQVEVTVTKVH